MANWAWQETQPRMKTHLPRENGVYPQFRWGESFIISHMMNTYSVNRPQVRTGNIGETRPKKKMIVGGSAGEPPEPWKLDAIYDEDTRRLQSNLKEALPTQTAVTHVATTEGRSRAAQFRAMLATRIFRDGKFLSESDPTGATLYPLDGEVYACN
jgi:hypothetical protein